MRRHPGGGGTRGERRWRGLDRLDDRSRPPRSLLLALVLASVTLTTLDHQVDDGSPVESARRAVGEAFGPVESLTSDVVRPFTSVPSWFHSKTSLRDDIRDLEAENADLREQVATSGFDRNRLAEFEGLTRTADDLGRSLVPARVVAYGSSQSFSNTVTIDAGSAAGVHPDMTVVNNDGLVGRVLRVTRSTATVLLVLDAESVVGGRLGESMELGFLHGRGEIGSDERLDLELVDEASVPAQGEPVVTWGSDGAGPYISGVPIGTVTEVFASLRDSSQRAVIEPYVDFSALDVVGVVVPIGSASDRAVVGADGSIG
ncbi:rod shape-determining protein MreC [Nocardioides sp. LHG3406-4]|uniref:rod shape-determining protein MreC n=1 Tax=Nocardioides sp. LHG3406-4 TaxID=2804575 RepID=UPI003CED8B08